MKYINNMKCRICGTEFSTGWCKTKLGMRLKSRVLVIKHYHTRAEVIAIYV